jgi:hypothetical protein
MRKNLWTGKCAPVEEMHALSALPSPRGRERQAEEALKRYFTQLLTNLCDALKAVGGQTAHEPAGGRREIAGQLR